ncbi:hypothetical protein KY339_01820 [Candidatus Woesearchaeota archaeon]|nr:hypothetical protein [Candidatus Woesearchaeota archaeon]
MKKKREINFFWVSIIFLIIVISFLFLYSPVKESIVGMVTDDLIVPQVETKSSDEILEEVESFANKYPLTRYVPDANICFLIQFPEFAYSYDIEKLGPLVTVTNSRYSRYCDGAENEDFIIKYVTYEKFLIHSVNIDLADFKGGGKGEYFYYIPSKFMMPGGDVDCNLEFRERYCGAMYYYMKERELDLFGLDCCEEDELSTEMLQLANQAGEQRELIAEQQAQAVEESSTVVSVLMSDLFIFSIIGVALLVLVVAGIFVFRIEKRRKSEAGLVAEKKEGEIGQNNEIKRYIESTLAMGYTREQVKQALKNQGWPEDKLNEYLYCKK